MATTARLLTYEDLLELPDDGKRYEIIDGGLFEMPSPSLEHQRLLIRFTLLIGTFLERTGLGEVLSAPLDIRLSPHNVVQPDFIVIRAGRLSHHRTMPVEVVPDLVIEVLSPSNREHDEQRKFQLYAAAGILEYWIADIEAKSLRGYILRNGMHERLPQDGPFLRSVVLAGLEIDVPALFADLS